MEAHGANTWQVGMGDGVGQEMPFIPEPSNVERIFPMISLQWDCLALRLKGGEARRMSAG